MAGALSWRDFREFFHAVHHECPFPWQERLAQQVLTKGWPEVIALPTAAGKTAVIDIALFALAAGAEAARRRIFFVVDRRLIVDQAAERAHRISRALMQALSQPDSDPILRRVAEALRELTEAESEAPLIVATLRGGQPTDDRWMRSPLQPVVCCTTVDQVGSALLFRSYGARSPANWPLAAGLVSHDSLVLVDEAHISQAFVETARRIQQIYVSQGQVPLAKPLNVVELTATPRSTGFQYTKEDLDDPRFQTRVATPKRATLVPVEWTPEENGGVSAREANLQRLVEALAEQALELAHRGCRRIAVIVNRVETARRVYQLLSRRPIGRTVLLTGRVRPPDRDQLLRQHAGDFRGPLAEGTAFIVATQCIEVGADFDFDGLVTEVASLDALRQRFGRLNRLGQHAVVEARIVGYEGKTGDDFIYGRALAATWKWLKRNAKKQGSSLVIDLGTLALEPLLSKEKKLEELLTPASSAAILLPAHLDHLSQTWPSPAPECDVNIFLHGPERSAGDVYLVWRADLRPDNQEYWADIVSVCPPTALEAMALPFYAVRQWLSNQQVSELADVDTSPPRVGERVEGGRVALHWIDVEESHLVTPDRIRPGMTLVVPASYGGCDAFGWNPASTETVRDWGDITTLYARGRATLRLDPGCVAQWMETSGTPLPQEVAQALEQLHQLPESEVVREFLQSVQAHIGIRREIRIIAELLLREQRPRPVIDPQTEGTESPRIIAIVGSRRWRRAPYKEGEQEVFQEDDRGSLTTNVELDVHSQGVAQKARLYAQQLGLPSQLENTLYWAGRLHDLGKLDPRFQSWLRGGVPWIPGHEPAWAKSGNNGRDRMAVHRARRIAGYPEGGRHELVSVRLSEQLLGQLPTAIDPDLLLHLLATHHGRCRPFAPIVDDPDPVAVTCELKLDPLPLKELSAPSQSGLERLDSGVSERFWSLTQRYGWYGLAFLEALLRLADQQQSRQEQMRALERR